MTRKEVAQGQCAEGQCAEGQNAEGQNDKALHNVGLHRTGNYVYASTQERRIDPETGRTKYRHVHWGRFDEETMRFHPNVKFMTLNPEERSRMRFPETWDLQELEGMSGLRPGGRPPKTNTGGTKDRLYGHIWLLEQISRKLGIHDDLLETFYGNQELVDTIFTLAIYPILVGNSFRRAERWQDTERTPTDKKLTSSVILQTLRKITIFERDVFLKLRRKRAGNSELYALNSAGRTTSGDTYSHAKQKIGIKRHEHKQTTELVVYSFADHLPVFYRILQDNICDTRSFNTIYNELKKAEFPKLVLITDRGYACLENIEMVIRDGTHSLLTAAPVNSRLVLQYIREFDELQRRFSDIELDIDSEIYFKQFKKEYIVYEENENKKVANDFCVNIYFDIIQRANEIICQARRKIEEEKILLAHKKDKIHIQDVEEFRNEYKYYDIEFENDTIKNYQKRESNIHNEELTFGFFAIVTIGVGYDAKQALDAYKRKDVQEDYFNLVKPCFADMIQETSSENNPTGRDFILFIGLVLTSYIRNIWNSTELRDLFDDPIDICDEMKSIKLTEVGGRLPRFTPFSGKQLQICKAFGFHVPEGCSPAHAGKRVLKRGRKTRADA